MEKKQQSDSPRSLLDTLTWIERHTARCRFLCPPGGPCQVLREIQDLPTHLILEIQASLASRVRAGRLQTPACYSLIIQLLSLRRRSLCLVRGCHCSINPLKVHSIQIQLCILQNNCNCPRCLFSSESRNSIEYNVIQNKVFYYVNRTIVELHLGLVSEVLVQSLPSFAHLKTLSLIPTSNSEAKSFSFHLTNLLQNLVIHCQGLEELSIECNPLLSFKFPADGFQRISMMSHLKLLYLVSEDVSADLGAELIVSLEYLQIVGLVRPGAVTCLLEDIHTLLIEQYGLERWPDFLLWIPSVNVRKASRPFLRKQLILSNRLHLQLLVAQTPEECLEEGSVTVRGNFGFYQSFTLPEPSMVRLLPFCYVSGMFLTSITFVLLKSTLTSREFLALVVSCPQLEKLRVHVKSISAGPQVPFEKVNHRRLHKLEVAATDPLNRTVFYCVGYAMRISPNIRYLNVNLDETDVYTDDFYKVFCNVRQFLKTVYLRGRRVHVTVNAIRAMLRRLPYLETLGYVNNWEAPSGQNISGFIDQMADARKNQKLKILSCSRKVADANS